MLTLTCPHCGIRAEEAELLLGCLANPKNLGSNSLAEAFNMWRFKEGQFIDESVAAGVAH